MLSRARVSHVLLISLVAGLLFGLPPVPAAAATSSGDHSVPVKSLASKVAPLPPMPQHKPRATAWPSAAAALIDVPAPLTRAAGSATVGGLPVSVSGVVQDADFPGARMAPVAQPAPAKVRVEVLDHAVSQRGGAPVAFKR